MSNRVLADKTTIPETICEREQWVCWKKTQRDGQHNKIPVTPGGGGFASSTDPETWAGFEIALEYARTGKADGVGFVFTDDDPIVGVDLDDCRDPETGEVDSEAQDIIERLDSYTEISPSGTGYHVLIEGELPKAETDGDTLNCTTGLGFHRHRRAHPGDSDPHSASTRRTRGYPS